MSTLLLLALDDALSVNFLSRALKAMGYEIMTVQDREGVNKVMRESAPGLVIIGSTFEKERGTVLAKSLVTEYPTLPIIFLATEKSDVLMHEALRTGVSAYLQTPLRTEDITEAIQSALQRSRKMGDWLRREVRNSTVSLEKRVSEMEVLLTIGKDLTGSLDLDSVLKNVVEAATRMTNADEGSLLLLDPETNELYMRAAHNFEKGFAESFRLPIKDTLAGQVIATGESVILNQDTLKKIKTSYLVQSLIYVPLKVNEKVIGVLGVDNRQHRLPFTERDSLLLSLLAGYATVAIENANLFKKSEEERSKFEAVFTNMDDALMILDEKGHIQLVNGSMSKAFSFNEEEVLGKTVPEIIEDGDFLALLEDKRQSQTEIELDEEHVFRAQYTHIDNVGAVITMHDISYLKKLDRLKDNFVHTVSHDLRSPLTAVLGYAELLERVGPITAQQKEFIRRIHASVRDITALINDLLDLGNIESGLDSKREMVQLDILLRYVLESLNIQMHQKKLFVTTDIDTNLPAMHGNPIRLKQMLDNLIGNAVKYTPEEGKVCIALKQEGAQNILKVEDQGEGIPLADQPHIFEKFYRGSNIPKEVRGTGLGLAIVKTIVEDHGGRIWVESKEGEGSTFTVVFPTSQRDAD